MAFKRFVIDGYGQLELNQVAFPRDGRVEAQCALDDEDFASVPAENGMLLAVDRVNRKIKFPTSAVIANCPVALNYTTEHMYDERANALKDFKLEKGTFYPRLGFLSVGELFTTNCMGYDAAFADDDAVREVDLSSTDVYGGVSDEGPILLLKAAPEEGPVLKVVEKTTMPDGQFAFKFQVLKA